MNPAADENEAPVGVSLEVARDRARGLEPAGVAPGGTSDWLRAALASLGDGVICSDAGGRVAFLNGVARALTGWSDEEANGRPLPEVCRIIDEPAGRLIATPGPSLARESAGLAGHCGLLLGRNGSECPIEHRVAPILDSQGEEIGSVLVFRDVSERRRTDLALAESEARQAAIFQTSLDAIVTIDQEGLVLEWNPAAVAMFGRSCDEVLGRSMCDLIIPPSLREAHRQGMARYLATGEGPVLGRRVEIQAIRVDGSEFPVELAIAKIPAEGPPVFTAHVRDITARKDADRRREARLAVAQILAGSPSLEEAAPRFLGAVCEGLGWGIGIIWALDEDAGVLRCFELWQDPSVADPAYDAENRRRTFAMGVGLPGLAWRDLRPAWLSDAEGSASGDLDRHRPRGAIAAPMTIGEKFLGVIEFFSDRVEEPDPDLLEMLATLGGQAGQFIERRRAEAELQAAKEEAEAANRAKTQFLAVLSHELRTPLNPILLATSAMLERPGDPEDLRPTLEMIRRNVLLQARLIDDLLDVMRIVQEKLPLHWEVVDAHRLLDRAIEICRAEVEGCGLNLIVLADARLRHVNADPARLQQVFWNLIRNAVKFTPEAGSITIRTSNSAGPGGALVVEVIDTGIGMEPEILSVVFNPFQQGETTITRRFGGLGLGLAICKGIVEAHGGAIAAESRGRGRGSTFRVTMETLPEPEAQATPAPKGPPFESSVHPSRPLRILAVEDEPTTLRLLARLLSGLGHRVATADSVASAIGAAEAEAFDLVISDLGLPDGSGLDLIRRVVALRGPVPAIALTGYGMDEDIRASRLAGYAAHLTKPIDFARLEVIIGDVAPPRT